jgi:hypothetical protein
VKVQFFSSIWGISRLIIVCENVRFFKINRCYFLYSNTFFFFFDFKIINTTFDKKSLFLQDDDGRMILSISSCMSAGFSSTVLRVITSKDGTTSTASSFGSYCTNSWMCVTTFLVGLKPASFLNFSFPVLDLEGVSPL